MSSELVVTLEDLHEAGHRTGHLKDCPFCGTPWPLTFTKYNPDTAIYRVEVVCSQWRCYAMIGGNSHRKPDARRLATAKWNRREEGGTDDE